MRDRGGSLLTEGIEKLAQRGLVPARGSPHQPAGAVVNDDGQILVSALAGDLVNADACQVRERVEGGRPCPSKPG